MRSTAIAVALVVAAPFLVPASRGESPPKGVSAGWWSAAQANIEASEYHVTWSIANGLADLAAAYQAPNRAHGFRTYFTEQGIRVIPRTESPPSWEWGLSLARWGRSGATEAAGDARLFVDGNRVEIDRGPIVEWFVNDATGLEQGFTIGTPPEGAGSGAPLVVDLALTGTLAPMLSEDGQAIDFAVPGGQRVIHYAQLVASDARGRNLRAWMEGFCEEGLRGIRLVVDDRDAAYPVTIDPLATSPAWTDQRSGRFGYSVAPAGDVNGDGYGDVIVGAPFADTGSGEEAGAAYVYHGSPSGPSDEPDWISYYGDTSDHYGYSVATAGDVNGDGYSDVIVGAPDRGDSYSGGVFVYHGSPTGLSESYDWSHGAALPSCWLGTSVASAGDVNGDGYGDVVVSGPGCENDQTHEGVVYVYMGSSSGLGHDAWTAESDDDHGYAWERTTFGDAVALAGDVNGDGYSDIVVGDPYDDRTYAWYGSASGLGATGHPANADWTATQSPSGSAFGTAVATAGDVNGDGYSDVIVGAPDWNATYFEAGAIFVYHGSATGLSSTHLWSKIGERSAAHLGTGVGTAGDVNGDGYSEVVAGSPGYDIDADGTGEGRAYTYFGASTGLSSVSAWTVDGDNGSGLAPGFGYAVATAGDVNGDGYSDVIVGTSDHEWGAGKASVYLGSPTGLQSSYLWNDEPDQAGAQYGFSVATAGDVNGDGYGDMIIGAPYMDIGETDEGAAYVYYGKAGGPNTWADWRAESDQAYARLGHSVATARDANGDGYSDIIAGAPYYDDGESDEGMVFVWNGGSGGLGALGTPSNAAWWAEANQASAAFGYSVASAGDVNGDGYSDVIVGVPYYNNGHTDEGTVYVYLGSPGGLGKPGTPANADWTAESNQGSAYLGYSVASAGDVNGDGYSDVIAGAYAYDAPDSNEGKAFAWYGSGTGLGAAGTPANADWSAEGNQAGGYFGHAVAGASDVNGDGFSDVAVGSYLWDGPTGANEGRVAVYHGSSSGLALSPAWQRYGAQADARLGFAVDCAGDVNGDGYADLVIGAPYYDGSSADRGRAYVFHGGATGLGTSPAWTFDGTLSGAEFGRSVASADINGDGFADVIVGAPRYASPETDEGRAYAFYGNGGVGRGIAPRQREAHGSAPIDRLGRSHEHGTFAITAIGRGVLGRGDVKLEWEAKPLGARFDGTGLERADDWRNSGTAGGALLSQVSLTSPPHDMYHWRVRVRQRPTTSPFQLWGRWMAQPWGGWNETDLKVLFDADGDGVPDSSDNCPGVPNPNQSDSDNDHVGDVCDNCPANANPGQEDADGDGTGNLCDPCTDRDGDGFGEHYQAETCPEDNCYEAYNPGQEDADGDDYGDACDICTDTDGDGFGDPGYPVNTCTGDNCPDLHNPDQADMDGDGTGDLCDADIDGDGWANAADCGPSDATRWSAPSDPRDLRVTKQPAGNLTWQPPANAGATSVLYDVLTTKKANDWGVFEAICVTSDTAALSATEPSIPLPGQVYHYLVRAEGPCGSNMGARSDGVPRVGRACP